MVEAAATGVAQTATASIAVTLHLGDTEHRFEVPVAELAVAPFSKREQIAAVGNDKAMSESTGDLLPADGHPDEREYELTH